MSTVQKQMEIERAMKRWRWAYFTGYGGAAYTAIFAILSVVLANQKEQADLASSIIVASFQIVIACIFALLAWRIHHHLSIFCVIALFVVSLISAIIINFEDNPNEFFGAWILVILMFRCVLSVHTLRTFRTEMLQLNKEKTEAQPAPACDAETSAHEE